VAEEHEEKSVNNAASSSTGGMNEEDGRVSFSSSISVFIDSYR
jgi:hypothetical protein